MTAVAVFRCPHGHVQDVPTLAGNMTCGAPLTDGTTFFCAESANRQGVRPCFDALPDVCFLPDGRLETQTAITYYAADGRAFHIPAGFPTDLASVPRGMPGVFRLLFRDELHTASAAILHDRLYQSAEVSRREADALFYEALRATHETRVGAFTMWAGVRLGGWLAWSRHRSGAADA